MSFVASFKDNILYLISGQTGSSTFVAWRYTCFPWQWLNFFHNSYKKPPSILMMSQKQNKTNPCKLFAFPGLHLVQISAFFLNVPSPEHDEITITLSLGFISNNKGGIMLTVSCLEILPFPATEPRISLRVIFNCHPNRCGKSVKKTPSTNFNSNFASTSQLAVMRNEVDIKDLKFMNANNKEWTNKITRVRMEFKKNKQVSQITVSTLLSNINAFYL
ncbi:hypothetical protein AGLY_015613 [Aphis glycines]|uniref:Uncharacterized protein n=1 Tax=Aphis glycines TaxID=307491 RepID=A0A6G0T004_APHGL|nr:hypothetical protein AGLY_015613 [Aphis glycines]